MAPERIDIPSQIIFNWLLSKCTNRFRISPAKIIKPAVIRETIKGSIIIERHPSSASELIFSILGVRGVSGSQ